MVGYIGALEKLNAGIYFHEADLPAADSSAEPPVNISANQAGVKMQLNQLSLTVI